ncbi:hypothetical protein [Streptomyces sp. NPDC019937]|uniref:hypothetical protein n=1 Tax=Streptomyces sp. NPDC019937 TaxID=3154787 RepID=UPI0033C4B4C9
MAIMTTAALVANAAKDRFTVVRMVSPSSFCLPRPFPAGGRSMGSDAAAGRQDGCRRGTGEQESNSPVSPSGEALLPVRS